MAREKEHTSGSVGHKYSSMFKNTFIAAVSGQSINPTVTEGILVCLVNELCSAAFSDLAALLGRTFGRLRPFCGSLQALRPNN